MSIFDFEELAAHLCGLDPDKEHDYDDAIFEKFGIDYCQFSEVAEALLPLAILVGPDTGGFSQNVRQGFGSGGTFFIKRDVNDPELMRLAGVKA